MMKSKVAERILRKNDEAPWCVKLRRAIKLKIYVWSLYIRHYRDKIMNK
jgi:hypothetical protein